MVYTQHLICLLAVLSDLAGASFLRGGQENEKAIDYDELDVATDDLMMMEAMEGTDDLMMFEAEEERNLHVNGRGRHTHGGFGRRGQFGQVRPVNQFGFGQQFGQQDGFGNFGPTVGNNEDGFYQGGVGGVRNGPYNYVGGVGAYNYATPYNNRGYYNGNANSFAYNVAPYANSYNANVYSYGGNLRSPYGYNSYNNNGYSYNNNRVYSPSYGYGLAPSYYGGFENNMDYQKSFFV